MLKAVVVGWICLMNCISCEYPALYDRYQPVEQTGWGKEKVYYFTFEVQDTAVPYDLTLNIRNNNLYPYQNLWLFCSEEHPIGPLRQSGKTRSNVCLPMNMENGMGTGSPFSIPVSRYAPITNFPMPANTRSASAKACDATP